jgi:hypothetical protein
MTHETEKVGSLAVVAGSAQWFFGVPCIVRIYGCTKERWQDCECTPLRWAGASERFVIVDIRKRVNCVGYHRRRSPSFQWGETAVLPENLLPNIASEPTRRTEPGIQK